MFSEVSDNAWRPLADRMRPVGLDDYLGQEHILAHDKPLRMAIEAGNVHSLILWGPPGVGKTSLARLIASLCDLRFEAVSAVLSGVKEIRQAVDSAKQGRAMNGRPTLLFIDEVHRFNKSQQDAFLPNIEDGTLIFIGATTENPSFELNAALLSRARVYTLRSLTDQALGQLLERCLRDSDKGLGEYCLQLSDAQKQALLAAADGDARRLLNLAEMLVDVAERQDDGYSYLSDAAAQHILEASPRRFDKGGDVFYEQISALHKAVRGSSPDAALYWLCRMLDGGCDPLYIARRLVRMASEDVGNADPRALSLAMDAWDCQTRLGSPEGELALAQAVSYLAVAPKSNAVYSAYKAARALVAKRTSDEVPIHLRNAPTRLMGDMGYGAEYRYAHDEPDAYAAGENYFPESLQNERFYFPVERGLELKIKQKLENLRERDKNSKMQRYGSIDGGEQ